jgi:hypothetical protein
LSRPLSSRTGVLSRRLLGLDYGAGQQSEHQTGHCKFRA